MALPQQRRTNSCLLLRLLGLLMWLWVTPVQAADPLRGAALFATPPSAGLLPCMECHSDNPLVNNFGNIYSGRNAVSLIQRAVALNTGGMNYFSKYYSADDLADIAAYLGNSPGALRFELTAIGGTSASQTVSVAASTKVGLEALAFQLSGDFIVVGKTCDATLARLATCAIDLAFRPTAAGPRTGALLITHDGTPTPVRITLAGEAPARPPAVASVAPQALAFGADPVGGSGKHRNITLANDSDVPLVVSALTVNESDYLIVGGSCIAGQVLPAGQRCTVALRFEPQATGLRKGQLTISHDGVGGQSQVSLSGTGQAMSTAWLQPAREALKFGAVELGGPAAPVQTLTLHNRGAQAWQMAEISSSHPAFLIQYSSCKTDTALAPQAQCQIAVAFQPQRPGLISAELRVSQSAPGQSLRIPLQGRMSQTGGDVHASPARLVFEEQLGASMEHGLTLVHRGGAVVKLGKISLAGPEASDFGISGTSTCQPGRALASGGNCRLNLRFSPGSAGDRVASLRIEHDGMASVTVIELRARARSAATSSLWLDRTALAFRARALSARDEPQVQRLVLSNRGRAALVWQTLQLNGAQAGDFTLGGTCSRSKPLAPAEDCHLELSFLPKSLGMRSASLILQAKDASSAAIVSVSGQALTTGSGSLVPDQALIDFARQARGGPMPMRRLTISNPGSAPSPVPQFRMDAPFQIAQLSAPCMRALLPGEACAVDIQFAPNTGDPVSGKLLLGAADEPAVLLTGQGVEAAAALSWQVAPGSPSHARIGLGSVALGTTLSVVNSSNITAGPLQWLISGSAAEEFSVDASSTCVKGLRLAPGAMCTLRLAFHPNGLGPRHALMSLSGDGPALWLPLQGEGMAAAGADLRALPEWLVFQAQNNVVPPTQSLRIRNEGSEALALKGVNLHGKGFQWSAADEAACSSEALVLLPGESCGLELGWLGTADGALPGTLVVSGDDALGNAQVGLNVSESPALTSNAGASGGGAFSPLLLVWLALACAFLNRLHRSHPAPTHHE